MLCNPLDVRRRDSAIVCAVGPCSCLAELGDEVLVDAPAVGVYFHDGGLVVGEYHGVAVGDQSDGGLLAGGVEFVQGH